MDANDRDDTNDFRADCKWCDESVESIRSSICRYFSQSNLLTLDLFTDEDGNNSIWLAAEPAAEQTETPTIDPVAAGDTTISGTAEPDSTVTVTIGNEQPVTAVADALGNWTAEVPEVSQGKQ